MSKMQELLDRIRDTLAGTDQSDTPQLRKLAETYAEACRTVNSELAACRELIDRGLWADAARRNDSVQPPWSRRAAILAIPEREQWVGLCRLYHYPPMPELDLETVQLLEDPPESGKAFNKLIMQWRRIARSGSSAEKVKLLRRIIAAAPPGGSELWHKNLAAAEKTCRKDLLDEADRAARARNMAALQTLYGELTDPAWLEPTPAGALKPFHQLLQEYQKEEFRNTVRNELNQLGTAYSALDVEQVRRELAAWDKLVTHPYFSVSAEEERQVTEVRKFLEEADARQRQQQEGEEKTRQLIMELDRHGDFHSIENLYESLRQSDFPIDATLDRRVAIRRGEFLDTERRRHRLRCFYIASGTILLLAMGGAAILFYQYHHASARYRAGMQEQLEARNYDAVLQLYRQAEAEDPRLVSNGNLADLKAEAERLKSRFLEADAQYADILRELDELWKSAEEPSLSLLRAKLAELDKLDPEHRSAELREKGRRHHSRCQELEERRQRRQDDEFLAALKVLEQDSAVLTARVQSQESARTEQEIAAIRRRTDALAAHSGQVSQELRERGLANLKLQLDNLGRTAARLRQREDLYRALRQPDNWEDYSRTLETLPEQAPDLAQGEWLRARQLLPLCQAVAQSALLNVPENSRDAFFQQTAAIRALSPDNPVLNDLDRLLPPESFSAGTAELLQEMQNLAQGACELIFRDENGRTYRFYPTARPKLEKRRNTKLPKTISFHYVPSYGGQSIPIVFRIPNRPDDNRIFFEKVAAGPLPLPAKLTDLTNADIFTGDFPPPYHSRFLNRALPRLRHAAAAPGTLEQEVFEQLKQLRNEPAMNPFIRLAILEKLLKLLEQCSDFYRPAIAPYQVWITRIGSAGLKNWNVPTEAIEQAETVQAIDNCFRELNVDHIRNFAAYCRDFHRQTIARTLTPAGVIVPGERNAFRVHWFHGMDQAAEIFLPVLNDTESAFSGFLMIDRGKLAPDGCLPEQYARNRPTGLVVFVPQAGPSAAALRSAYLKTLGNDYIPVWPSSWPQNCREVMP